MESIIFTILSLAMAVMTVMLSAAVVYMVKNMGRDIFLMFLTSFMFVLACTSLCVTFILGYSAYNAYF